MKIYVGCQRGKVTIEKGSVTVEVPDSRDSGVSVKELASALEIDSGPNRELLESIESLFISPAHPHLRIQLKDGRSVWIRIYPESLEVLCYSKETPLLPEQTIIPFPKKV